VVRHEPGETSDGHSRDPRRSFASMQQKRFATRQKSVKVTSEVRAIEHSELRSRP